MKTLHFTRFELFEVVIPCRSGCIEGRTPATWPDLPILLVRGTLSDGTTALTEFDRGILRDEAESMLRLLQGRNLFENPPTAPLGLQPEIPMLYTAFCSRQWDKRIFATLECLALDALGKHWGVPAHFFLGGAAQQTVATDFWCNQPSPATLSNLIQEAKRLGVRGWKMKAGLDRNAIEAALRIADEFGPQFRITIDPMGAWRSPLESAHLWRELRDIKAAVQIEDPFPHQHPALWEAIARSETLPLIWHPRTMEAALTGLNADFASGFNFGMAGSAFTYLAGLAEASGRPCWQGSSIETGVFQHYRLHSAAAAPSCVLGSDLCSEWVRESTLITPRMTYHEGRAVVPNRPGLGVELDETAVQQYCRSFSEIHFS